MNPDDHEDAEEIANKVCKIILQDACKKDKDVLPHAFSTLWNVNYKLCVASLDCNCYTKEELLSAIEKSIHVLSEEVRNV